jgi:hypothetical protein
MHHPCVTKITEDISVLSHALVLHSPAAQIAPIISIFIHTFMEQPFLADIAVGIPILTDAVVLHGIPAQIATIVTVFIDTNMI